MGESLGRGGGDVLETKDKNLVGEDNVETGESRLLEDLGGGECFGSKAELEGENREADEMGD